MLEIKNLSFSVEEDGKQNDIASRFYCRAGWLIYI